MMGLNLRAWIFHLNNKQAKPGFTNYQPHPSSPGPEVKLNGGRTKYSKKQRKALKIFLKISKIPKMFTVVENWNSRKIEKNCIILNFLNFFSKLWFFFDNFEFFWQFLIFWQFWIFLESCWSWKSRKLKKLAEKLNVPRTRRTRSQPIPWPCRTRLVKRLN